MLELLTLGLGALIGWLLGLGLIFGILAVAVVVVFFVFWIKAIVEIVTARNKSEWKVIWLLVVILLSWVGLILYYILAHKEAKLPKRK